MKPLNLKTVTREELVDCLTRYIAQMTLPELKSLYTAADSLMGYHDESVAECPYCHSKYIVKNGHKHEKQAYLCKSCGKSFVSTTGTLEYRSRSSRSDWAKAIECTLKGQSLETLCKELGISHSTAFYMRHKILRALELSDNTTPAKKAASSNKAPSETVAASKPVEETAIPDSMPPMSAASFTPIPPERALVPVTPFTEAAPTQQPLTNGTVCFPFAPAKSENKSTAVKELDETYVLDNYKGTRIPEDFYRGPRVRGGKAQNPGISFEQVCICACVEREGSAYAKTVNRAKPTNEELQEAFEGQLESGSLILCDGLQGYKSLSQATGCDMCDVNKAPKEEENVLNLNKVNNFHSQIKQWHRQYRGVATKYQNRYNILYCIAYKLTPDKLSSITKKLLTSPGDLSDQLYRTYTDIRTDDLLPLGDITVDPERQAIRERLGLI